ncbi:MAG: PFL family protein [Oscillospiraceae bacterium]|nr:PFL family protein [Oscillospiraceae bacterium]
MINQNDILETLKMIKQEHLDIRTVTLGISLLDCADSDSKKACKKVYDKVTKTAENHVKVCEEIEKRYGIPIINKRISVTPISLLASCSVTDADSPVCFAHTLQKAADTVGVNFIGGYSALVHKGFAAGDRELIESIPQALAETTKVCSSVNIGSTRAGINIDAAAMMGRIIVESAKATADNFCFGAAKIVVFCNAVEDNPFMAGAFHGTGEPDSVINVGVSGPGVVRSAVAKMPDADIGEIAEVIKRTAFKVTRMGQLVGAEAAKVLGIPFGIVDLSLAPTPAVGDSVAYILEEMGLEKCGAYGTTAALALLNDAVKKGGVMASSSVGGLSGAFIPVSEDAGMIAAVKSGALSLEKLEAMTAVCSVGLDMVVVPGDTESDIIAAMIADSAAIGMINGKTTAVRVIPAIGKKEGEVLEFGGLFGSGPVMPVNRFSPARFISRGGRIPAPLQSLKN